MDRFESWQREGGLTEDGGLGVAMPNGPWERGIVARLSEREHDLVGGREDPRLRRSGGQQCGVDEGPCDGRRARSEAHAWTRRGLPRRKATVIQTAELSVRITTALHVHSRQVADNGRLHPGVHPG
jgi:hypothetical protein